MICFAYPHLNDAIKTRRCNMKVAKAIDLYLDYHRLNSQKKYEPFLWVPAIEVPKPIF
jgi:hypothetical protein